MNAPSQARRIVVTGASTGIGAATVLRLAAAGEAVWITYRNDAESARQVADAALRAGASDVRVSQVDVGDADETIAFAAEVTSTWGSLTGLVNNAGMCPYTPIEQIDLDEWARVMDVNVRSVFLLTRELLPALREGRSEGEDRSIVNIASTAGQSGSSITGMHYSTSKGAVLAMSRSFAQHLAPERIRVNAVAPGPVVSVMTEALQGDGRVRMLSRIPLGAFGEADDVASTIEYLLGSSSRFVTGATYDVNGGTRMG